jgi:hypothetical protein
MSVLRRSVFVALVFVAGCSRRAASTPPPVRHAPPAPLAREESAAEREHERERERGPLGESSAQEIMERQREISPYAPDEAGLAQLMRDVVAAAASQDRARLERLLVALVPDRERLSLALTFEGDRVMGPFLTGPNAPSRDDLLARASRWARMSQVTVHSATGAELAQGAPAAAGVDPGMRRIAPMLRPLARFYRVTLAEPGTSNAVALDTFLYAGGRWMYVPEPWHAAPGAPGRGTVAPGPAWGARIPAMPRAR